MKKKAVLISIEVLLLFVLVWIIVLSWDWFRVTGLYKDSLDSFIQNSSPEINEAYYAQLNDIKSDYTTSLTYSIFSIIAALATLAAMVLIAIYNFPVFKPLVDKFNAKRAARKDKRAAEKEEKAEADKKARIAELQAELDELKKDE